MGVDKETARDLIGKALDAGITSFDSSNGYSGGSSEEYTGSILWSMARREDIVLATRVYSRVRPGPYGGALSRKAILHEIDESLRH